MKVYINGAICDKEDAKISVLDHGLLYGDGVFEGIRFYNNRIFKLTEHLDRLYEGACAIMLDIPMSKQEMTSAVVETVAAEGKSDGYIRLIVTRGIGKLGIDPHNCTGPQIIIIVDSVTLYPKELYEKGMEIITIPTRRNLPAAVNPRVKSLNYLNNVLAKIEALGCGYSEALILNAEGSVAEATGDNIFIVKNGVLKTPSVDMGILEGITRDTIIQLAKARGIESFEGRLDRHDVFTADECFLSGTAAEIIPVIKVDGRTIGNGTPGAVTLELTIAFHKLTQVEGVEIKDRAQRKASTPTPDAEQ